MIFRALFLLLAMSALTVAGECEENKVQVTLEESLNEITERLKIEGVGGIISQHGEVIGIAVAGVQKKGSDDPVQEDDLWHLGSITKSMTGTLIGRLVDEGHLSYDSTLPELLPSLSGTMHSEWQSVTLNDLMTHRSGMPRNGFPLWDTIIWPDSPDAVRKHRQRIFRKMLRKAPESPAGEVFKYSNSGITLAGHIAEEATDTPYELLIIQKVFEPLNIESVGFGAPKGDNPWGHGRGMLIKRATRADNPPMMGPAGRAHMSLQDLIVYGQAHLDGMQGRSEYLRKETWERLHSPQSGNYAHGWYLEEREWAHTILWHDGTNRFWYSILILIPESEMVLAFTTNESKYYELQDYFFDLARKIKLSTSK